MNKSVKHAQLVHDRLASLPRNDPYPYKYSDAGRSRSKRARQRYDCTVIALAHATGESYDTCYDLLKDGGRVCWEGFNWHKWMVEHVLDKSVLGHTVTFTDCDRVGAPAPLTVRQFMATYAEGTYIVGIRGHVFTVKDGVAYDAAWKATRPDRVVTGFYKFTPLENRWVESQCQTCFAIKERSGACNCL